MANRHNTEVHAYQFIKEQLKLVSWDVRNPSRVLGGQVWTQNECRADSSVQEVLGLRTPENIVKVTDRVLWMIEAKSSHSKLEQALEEAEEYARDFEGSDRYTAPFISGVAGNDLDSFLVQTKFFDGGDYRTVTLNRVPTTGLLRQQDLLDVLESGNPDLSEPEIDDRLFILRAEKINEILYEGAVNPHQRAGLMAALLLSMIGGTTPNMEERQPDVLINDINARAMSALTGQGKTEFGEYIRINLPATRDNHVKLRTALVDTLQELHSLNIRSAMNSGADWLGAFYEVFLKYAKWAQDLGIVLTPRHLTQWAVDAIDVKANDIVYDPTCGTGGFLVAALDYVKRHSDEEQLERFKQHSVFGIEQDAGMASLAVVNMMFRGDGKNNILEGNCFSKSLVTEILQGTKTARYVENSPSTPAVSKVLMNPPFALKREDEKEFRFIERALAQMEYGGVLFSILPHTIPV